MVTGGGSDAAVANAHHEASADRTADTGLPTVSQVADLPPELSVRRQADRAVGSVWAARVLVGPTSIDNAPECFDAWRDASVVMASGRTSLSSSWREPSTIGTTVLKMRTALPWQRMLVTIPWACRPPCLARDLNRGLTGQALNAACASAGAGQATALSP